MCHCYCLTCSCSYTGPLPPPLGESMNTNCFNSSCIKVIRSTPYKIQTSSDKNMFNWVELADRDALSRASLVQEPVLKMCLLSRHQHEIEFTADKPAERPGTKCQCNQCKQQGGKKPWTQSRLHTSHCQCNADFSLSAIQNSLSKVAEFSSKSKLLPHIISAEQGEKEPYGF